MAKIRCLYCGNNPVPHFLTWYFESTNILFTPLRQWLLYNPLAESIKSFAERIRFAVRSTEFLHEIGIITYQTDVHACNVSRAKVLWEEAILRGISFTELKLFGNPFDTYLAEKDGRKIVFSGLPRPLGTDWKTLDSLDDKLVFKNKLLAYGIPTPQGGAATNMRQALKIFNRIQKPVIVKPRAGSRGRHSTTYVYNEEQLKSAVTIAQQLCHWVIVEEHIEGPVYRGTVINFKLGGVLRGDAPQVIGDGICTIAELVQKKNKLPHPGVTDIILDGRTDVFLGRQGLSIQSVAKEGQIVYLSEKVGINYGGSSSEDYEICHPDNKEIIVQAAKVLGDPIVGFDFIIPDITRSYKEQRMGFIEANSLPFIDLHHHPLLGNPRNVAKDVWELAGF